MEELKICSHCGANISLKYNAYPGSCTEMEHYDCPKCGKFLFSSKDSGYYELFIVPENTKTCDKDFTTSK